MKTLTIPITFLGFTQILFNTSFYGILSVLPFVYSTINHFGLGLILVGEFLLWIQCMQVGWFCPIPLPSFTIRWKPESDDSSSKEESKHE